MWMVKGEVMNLNSRFSSLLMVMLFWLSAGALADDTDIYFGASNENAAQPLVMLTLDWRPNLGTPLCDLDKGDCEEALGERILDNLDKTSGVVTLFDAFRGVLRAVFENVTGVRVGFMLNHDNTCTGGSTTCSNGAYILSGFNEFSIGGYTLDVDGLKILNDPNKQALLDKLRAIPLPQGVESHPFQGKELYFELFQYLTGGEIINGHKGYGDYASQNPGGTPDLNLDDPNNKNKRGETIPVDVAWDTSIENGSNYISPYTADQDWSCSKTYVINTMFQVSQQEDDSDTKLKQLLGWTGLTKTFPDVVKAMNNIDHAGNEHDLDGGSSLGPVNVAGQQNVVSFFLVAQLNKTTLGYGSAGGGAAYEASQDPEKMIDEIEDIFNGILSVSTSFVAGSVPVNVIDRSRVLDNVYFAIFEGDRKSRPGWPGNLKKFALNEIEIDGVKVLRVEDVNGKEAFNPVTGRIAPDALSYWTDSAGYDVQLVEKDQVLEQIAGKDGGGVYRGGAGQRIPGFLDAQDNSAPGTPGLSNDDTNGDQLNYSARQLFLDPLIVNNTSINGNTLIPVRADINLLEPADQDYVADIAASFPVVPTDAEVVQSLSWVRGLDVDDLDGDGVTNEVRTYLSDITLDDDSLVDIPWMMGDIIHSRPKAINYGCSGIDCTPDIRLVFGANDGFFRMVNDGDGDQGEENWAFMPREMLKNISKWRSQTLQGYKYPYGVDGEPAILVLDNNSDNILSHPGENNVACTPGDDDCDKVYAYFGLRRGGNSYYALDISNPDSPPALLWSVTKNDLPGEDFSELGLTFGTPQLTLVQFQTENAVGDVGFGDLSTLNEPIPTPVVIVPGGYYGGWTDDFSGRVGKDDLSYEATEASPDVVGNAIYILHARTGELLKKFTLDDHSGMIHSIPSTITLWDQDRDEITDRLYVGDSGGNIWRIDLTQLSGSDVSAGNLDKRDEWFVTKFAELGSQFRFFHKPAVAAVRDSQADLKYDAVAIGTGDRAHPLEADTANKFLLLKDTWITQPRSDTEVAALKSRAPITMDDLLDITDICINGCNNEIPTGWSLDMEESGEKVLSAPLLIAGELFFTSYIPTPVDQQACEAKEGESRLYIVSLINGAPTRHLHSSIDSDFTKQDRYTEGGIGIVGDPLWLKDMAGLLNMGYPAMQSTNFSGRFDVFWRNASGDVVH
ncbi:MAG: hypothetical protein EP324_04140 [Gammaproteobacteria bacterium]|nr:MAG: hypothetical protein EP324_04140 [Gammaproteobacteria bacterium]